MYYLVKLVLIFDTKLDKTILIDGSNAFSLSSFTPLVHNSEENQPNQLS